MQPVQAARAFGHGGAYISYGVGYCVFEGDGWVGEYGYLDMLSGGILWLYLPFAVHCCTLLFHATMRPGNWLASSMGDATL